MCPPRKTNPSRKRKRSYSTSRQTSDDELAKATKRSRPAPNKPDPGEIDAIYQIMKDHIEIIDQLFWLYVPKSLAVLPKGSDSKQVLDLSNKEGIINPDKINGNCIIKYRIRGLGKRYFDLTPIQDLNERIKIITNLKKIHHPATAQKNRRLDSLARLLEGTHTCVAVFHNEHSKKLFITANNIHAGTKHESYKLITDIMEYFTNPKSHDRREIFERICLARIRSMDKSGLKISDRTIKIIADYILRNPNWMKSNIEDLLNIAIDNSRVINTDEQVDILRVFLVIGSLAKDFKKVEKTFNGENFEVLSNGVDGVHAELRMIDCLLKSKEIDLANVSQYIGISRLCCPKCETAIETINFTMKKGTIRAEDVIETRGEHGIRSGDKNWQAPDFLDDRQVMSFPEEMQKDIDEIKKNYHLFSVYSTPMENGKYLDKARYRKVCKILNLIEGNAINLVKDKYHFENTVANDKSIIAIEEVLKDKPAFLTNTLNDFVSLTIQGEKKYLNLKKLRDKNQDFNEVYQDLLVLHHSPGKEEKKTGKPTRFSIQFRRRARRNNNRDVR